jgi:hypothetical protein
LREVVKAYSIPVKPPKDLVEAYFKVKEKALDEIMNCIAYSNSGKAIYISKLRKEES